MSALLAAALTTCQTAFGVILSPQISPNRFTRRKIAPPLMPAAVVHSSTARFAHNGTGTVRMCFPLPIRSAITQHSSRTWKSAFRVHLVACRSELVTADAAGGVRVLPLDRPSIGGVGVEVASEFASQVGNRGEDAARDDLAFDLGEPDLDLVEPGRVSGREVKPDSRMLLEELADRLSFVRGKIVEDDVNLLPRRAQGYDLLQKGDELTAGMAGSGFAVDATGGGIERCI